MIPTGKWLLADHRGLTDPETGEVVKPPVGFDDTKRGVYELGLDLMLQEAFPESDYRQVTGVEMPMGGDALVVFLDVGIPCEPGAEKAARNPKGGWIQYRSSNFTITKEDLLRSPRGVVDLILVRAKAAVVAMKVVGLGQPQAVEPEADAPLVVPAPGGGE